MDPQNAIVLVAYAAMAAELLFIAVPSVVSTRQRLRRLEGGSLAAKLARLVPIVLIILLFLVPPAAAFAPGLIEYLGPLPQLEVPALRWIGVGLLVFGKILTPISVPPLRRALDAGLLARSGCFARSRHPGLVGMFAFYLGNSLVFPCVVLFAGFPCFVLYMHRRALMEEDYLRARFPLEYEEYAARVPRYVGIRSFTALPGRSTSPTSSTPAGASPADAGGLPTVLHCAALSDLARPDPGTSPAGAGDPAPAPPATGPIRRAWIQLRRNRAVVAAVVVASLLFLQVSLAAYYWIPDPTLATVLGPTWDAPVLVMILAGWAALAIDRRWASRLVTIGLTFIAFLYFLLGLGQGFALREFGYDVVLRLHVAYVPELFRMMYSAEPLGWFVVYVAILAIGVVAIATALYGAIRVVQRTAAGGRRRQVQLAGGALAYLLIGAFALGVNGPLTGQAVRQIDLAVNLHSRLDATARHLEVQAARLRRARPFAGDGPRPDILVFVVESYGDVLLTDPELAPFPDWLEQQGQKLAAAGYRLRSKHILPPVFGGSSWLADATLLCGVKIDSQRRYAGLFESAVRCLPSLFKQAGYRPVIVAPEVKYLEESYAKQFKFDRYYFRDDFGYRGPRMGWSLMPDQFAIDFVERHEIAPRRAPAGAAAPGRQPLFVFYHLTTSHHPWKIIPPYIDDWARIGDGSIYADLDVTQHQNRFVTGANYKQAYRDSVQYSMRSIVDYLARLPPEDRSLIFILGDHQPRRPVAMTKKDPWYVPIHVASRDPAAVDRFARVGYHPGITPRRPTRRPSPMESFTAELFTVYGADPKWRSSPGRR